MYPGISDAWLPPFCWEWVDVLYAREEGKLKSLIRYYIVYLTCSKKLTGIQLSPPHGLLFNMLCLYVGFL